MNLKTRLSDIIIWVVSILSVQIVSYLPWKLLLPITRLIGKVISLPKNAGKDYEQKVRPIIPDSPIDVGKKYISHRPESFFLRVKYQGLITEKRLENLYEVQGLEHLDRALKEGRGTIIQMTHFGAFEPAFLYLARKGYKINVIRAITDGSSKVASPLLNKKVTKDMLKMLAKVDIEWIYFKPENSYTSLIWDLLSKNEIIITFSDVDAPYYIDAPFFNGKLRLASNSAFLAWKYNVPLVALFCARKKNKYSLTIEEPYYPVNDMNNALHNATCRLAALYEKYVRAYPDQWNILQNLKQSINEDGTWTLSMRQGKAKQYYDPKDFGLE